MPRTFPKISFVLNYWFPVILWMGLIFFVSGIPRLNSNLEYDLLLKKSAHVAEYFVLAWLLNRAFRGSFSLQTIPLYLWTGGLSILYAISDEFHQSFVPGRHAAASDVLIDAAGVLCFCLWHFWHSRRSRS
jgi:VanZ family protein